MPVVAEDTPAEVMSAARLPQRITRRHRLRIIPRLRVHLRHTFNRRRRILRLLRQPTCRRAFRLRSIPWSAIEWCIPRPRPAMRR